MSGLGNQSNSKSKIVNIIKVYILITVFILGSCGNTNIEIIDYYRISKYFELSNGENVLYCKLGFEGDPIIENIKKVEWNERIIKLENTNSQFYLILANKEKLCCGCGDEIIGPMNQSEYSQICNERGISNKLKNQRELK